MPKYQLLFGSHTLESLCGVQQGDPLGPLFLAIALHKIACNIRQHYNLDLALFYLDDGVLAGDLDHAGAALRHFQAACQSIGLRLNLGKCELAVMGQVPEAALSTSFPPALLHTDGGAGSVLTNFEFLGVPSVASWSSGATQQTGLPKLQVGLRLVRGCGGYAGLVHSTRCNPPQSQTLALEMFDGMVRRCFGGFTGIHPSAARWQQAARGLAHGGRGLHSCEQHASPAFLASAGGSLSACAELDAAFQQMNSSVVLPLWPPWPTSMRKYRSRRL